MIVVGLTGNIGCGKSTVSNILKKLGVSIIDADIVSREILLDTKVLNLIFDTFGNSIKNTDNTLNRKKLGDIVFNDEKELIKLNNITHPKIKENILNQIKNIKNDIVVIDAALLIEANYLDIVDKIILVVCDESLQIKRILERDFFTKEEVIKRINPQMPQDKKREFANYIIDNSFSLYKLEDEVKKILVDIRGDIKSEN